MVDLANLKWNPIGFWGLSTPISLRVFQLPGKDYAGTHSKDEENQTSFLDKGRPPFLEKNVGGE